MAPSMAADRRAGVADAPAAGITVIGTGTATAPTELAALTVTIEILRPDAGRALAAATAAAAGAVAVLGDCDIAPRSIRTAEVSLGPKYEVHGGERMFTGYSAARQLRITTDEPAGLADVVSELVARAGEGLRVDSLAQGSGNVRGAAADARTAAMIDAREQAHALATLAGRPLGSVEWITDEPTPANPVALTAHSATESGLAPATEGQLDVTVSLRVHFSWDD